MATDLQFMTTKRPFDIASFFIVGINYKKTDAKIRGMFSIGNAQYENILNLAPSYGVYSLFILSTCNRTEIYGFAEKPSQLIDLLCTQTNGDTALFSELAYIKAGKTAVEHLFNVGAGLDSQLLGDYEIVGQLKLAVKFAKDRNFINCFLERLFNNVLQSSKTIKNKTALSDGTISVSFAAVQYIKEHVACLAGKKILLLGAGKIGRNICKNLVAYLNTHNITLINRTEEKAAILAEQLNVKHSTLNQLSQHIEAADIIITATNAEAPIILYKHLKSLGEKLIIDLSIPHNVEETVGRLANIHLVNVDELSKRNDLTLEQRKAEAPKAISIVNNYVDDFINWYQMHKNAPVLKAIKLKLNEIAVLKTDCVIIGDNNSSKLSNEQLIQKVVNGIAGKMRTNNQGGCYYIQAINEFITTNYN
jgi:glutamyl-tRNA reductase